MPKALQVTFPSTVQGVARLEKREKSAVVRQRLNLVRLVLQGTAATQVASMLGLNAGQACLWIKRFNASGPEGLRNRPRRSRRSRLKAERVESFKKRVREGAQARDGVSVLRGKDFQRILKEEFGASCSLGGAYFILHRLGFASLSPRPRHPSSDPDAQAEFKKTPRTVSTNSRRPSR